MAPPSVLLRRLAALIVYAIRTVAALAVSPMLAFSSENKAMGRSFSSRTAVIFCF